MSLNTELRLKPLWDSPGVYAILNLVTGKVYVGSSCDSVQRRVSHHLEMLRNGRHYNLHLQSSWNKHGSSSFNTGALEICSRDHCLLVEQKWIDRLSSADPKLGYNICPKAVSRLGSKVSEESRVRISVSQMGKKLSDEHKIKVAIGNLGKKMSGEAKVKISRALIGNKNGVGSRPPVSSEVRMARVKNLTGCTFGRLTVVEFHSINHSARWSCRCSCGNKLVVYGNNLTRGNTRSCGCLLSEIVAQRNRGKISASR